MKGNKFISLMLTLVTAMTLAACSNETDSPKTLSKEGIAPYELSASEKHILQSFGMEDSSQLISFHAPKEATALHVNVYQLEADETWGSIGGGTISMGADAEPSQQLSGTFAMQLKENFAIEFNINANGRFSYQTDETILAAKPMASAIGFLQEFQQIEMNTEIPIALMVYDGGTSMKNYSLQDYFAPATFEGMDFVQMVTLTFADEEF